MENRFRERGTGGPHGATSTAMSRADFVSSMIALLEEKEKSTVRTKVEGVEEKAAENAFQGLLYDYPNLSASETSSLSESLVRCIAHSKTAALPKYFTFRSKYFESLVYLAKRRRDAADDRTPTQDSHFSALVFASFVLLPLEMLRGRFSRFPI